jgi:hypothetical protein
MIWSHSLHPPHLINLFTYLAQSWSYDQGHDERGTPDSVDLVGTDQAYVMDKCAMRIEETTRGFYFLACGGMYLIISLASSFAMSLRLGLMNI